KNPITNGTDIPVWISSLVGYMDKKYPKLHYKWDMDRAAGQYEDMANAAALSLAPQYAVATAKTSLSGEAEVADLPAGTYWISNMLPTQIANSIIQWNVRVVVEIQKKTDVELSNDNAALLLP